MTIITESAISPQSMTSILININQRKCSNIQQMIYTTIARVIRKMAGRKPTISDSEIIQFFTNSDDPFLTTGEVADLAEFSTNSGANKQLTKLESQGYVESKNVGRGLAWWVTDAGCEYLEAE